MGIFPSARLFRRQCFDAFKHVPPMILPPEKDAEHPDFTVTLIDQKVEHGPSLCHVAQALHDRWLQGSLKRHIAQARHVVLDSTDSLRCAFESDIRCVTEITIGALQVIKDQVEVRVASDTANNLKA